MQKEKILESDFKYIIGLPIVNQNKAHFLHKPIITFIASAFLLVADGQNVYESNLNISKDIILTHDNYGNNNYYLGNYNAMNTLTGLDVFSMEKIAGLNTINEIRKLGSNWNGNNAEPFRENLLQKSTNILYALEYTPDIYPTACNSIQFEYEKESGEYLEFEIFDKYISVFKINQDKSEEEFIENDINKIKKLVKEFYDEQYT